MGCPAGVATASCLKRGYNFNVTASGPNPIGGYTVNANPAAFGQSGQRYFDSDISGVIRYNLTAIASVTDQPIQ